MKNNKLLASLKKAIQAAEMMMDSEPKMTQEEGPSTMLSGGGASKKVQVKEIDFTNQNIVSITYEECPGGICPPVEFNGSCCVPNQNGTYDCRDGFMAGECASQAGIFRLGVSCAQKKCEPVSSTGRCCVFDPSAGWDCIPGLTENECAQQNGNYEQGVQCNEAPPCGGTLQTQNTNMGR